MKQVGKKIILMCLVMVLVVAGCVHVVAEEERDKIYIALTVMLSGSGADSGRLAKEAAEFWVEQFNANGGFEGMNADLELVIYDVTSTADQSKTVLERALTEHDFAAVAISCVTGTTLTQLPVCERAGIPAVFTANGAELYSQGYTYTFGYAPYASDSSAKLAEVVSWLNQNGYNYSKAAILYEDTSVGSSYADGYREKAEQIGLEVVYDKSYQANLTDASSIAQAIKATGAEVILGSMVGQDSKTISEAFAAIDYHPLWLGVSALLSYGETMGEACNGQMATTNWSADTYVMDNNPEYAQLRSDFEELSGHFVAEKTGSTWCILDIITQAIEIAGTTDPEAIQQVLATTTFDTMTSTGKVKFDETGYNTLSGAVVGQWQNGVCVGIYPQDLCTGTYIDPSDF